MPLMIWAAAAIEGAIENFADMGILLGIQFINASISFYETQKVRPNRSPFPWSLLRCVCVFVTMLLHPPSNRVNVLRLGPSIDGLGSHLPGGTRLTQPKPYTLNRNP